MAPYVTNVPSVSLPLADVADVKIASPVATAPNIDAADPSRFRLTIEARGGGRFVYKVLDRVTGEVIRQLPREEVERLNLDPTYSGGRLVNAAV